MSAMDLTPREIQHIWCKMTGAPQDVYVCESLNGYNLIIGARANKFRRRVGVGTFTHAIDLHEFKDCVRLAMDDFAKGRV